MARDMDPRTLSCDHLLYGVDSFNNKNRNSPLYYRAVPDALVGTTDPEEFYRIMIKNRGVRNKFIYSPPLLKPESDTSITDNTTKFTSGCVDENNKKNISVTSMIQKRNVGEGFTRSQQCRMMNHLIEARRVDRIKYKGNANCGVHSADGKYFVAAEPKERCLWLYSAVKGKLEAVAKYPISGPLEGHHHVLEIAFSPDGNHFAYCGSFDYLNLCSIHDYVGTIKLYMRCQPSYPIVSSMAISNDGKEIIASRNSGRVEFVDVERQQLTLEIKAHLHNANAARFVDNTSQVLMTAGENGTCKFWDRRTTVSYDSKPVGVMVGHERGITYIDPKGDGRYFITNSKDQTIKLWDFRVLSERIRARGSRETKSLGRDKSVMTYRGHVVLNTLMRCRFSPAATTAQQYIYTGSGDGSVVIYDVLTGGKVSQFQTSTKTCIRDVSWHPYQPYLVSCSWDGSIETWTPIEPL